MFRRLLFCIGILFIPLLAIASNVSITQDVTIILPSDSSEYLLKASSSFETFSVAVSASSFSFVMNPGDSVVITSAGDRELTNTINVSTTCGSPSEATLSVSTTQTVTVTPGGACTTSSSSSGGGGGGGGMIVGSGPTAPSAAGLPGYTPPRPQIDYPNGTVVYLGATTTASTSPPTAPTTSSSSTQSMTAAPPSTSYQFTLNRQLWDESPDILALQQFLNSHGFTVASTGPGSPGNETDYFGTKTYQALVKFQQGNNLPATGYFGPLTRALINSQPH
jgi:Putative peptidoglycan binding domain